jgi:folate-binding Fe-S cluster repair protein YgfZ
MEKDQIILLEDRGLISITGEDAKNFFKILLLMILKK